MANTGQIDFYTNNASDTVCKAYVFILESQLQG